MIGNGFDLNLGLKTGYKDFYKYYTEKAPESDFSKSIQSNYELWADLELGLGNYLENVTESSLDDFLSAKEEMENLLIEYLKNEEQCFQISDPKVLSTDFQKKIKNMYTEFDATNQNLYNQLVLSSNEQIDFSFITFNYTNTLDKIIECVSKNCTPFHTHIHNSNTKTDIISAPLHIHGTLDDREMILGINDVSQINNDVLRNNVDLADYIVKTNVNRGLGQGKIDKAKGMINESRYLCLFGLSIGDTDSYWWAYIIDWLLKDQNRHLVIFVNSKTTVQSAQQTIRFQKRHKRNFLKKTTKEINEAIMNQIIIIPNSRIFTFSGIAVEKQKHENHPKGLFPVKIEVDEEKETLVVS